MLTEHMKIKPEIEYVLLIFQFPVSFVIPLYCQPGG